MIDKVHLVLRSVRRCFYRGEQALLRFELMNFVPHNLKGCRLTGSVAGVTLPEIEIPVLGPFQTTHSFTIDTAPISSGRYTLELNLGNDDGAIASASIPFAVAPPQRTGGMKLWHWPATVHYNALELSPESGKEQLRLLASMGFDWAQLRADWAIRHFEEAVALIEEAMMLGIELGILIENGGGGRFRHLPSDPADARLLTVKGEDPVLANAFHPEVERRNRSLVEHLCFLFGEFPSCTTLFMNSEVEDKLKLPFDAVSIQRHQRALGFSLCNVNRLDPIFGEKLSPPSSGVIPDDDPDYCYARYYFKDGDGFVHTNRLMAETAHRMRPGIITISDPLRNCSVYGRFDGLDAVSSWTYTNPDPKATLFVETLECEAKEELQMVIPTITLWNYAGTLTPSGTDRFAREQTLRMEPDRYKECAWFNFSRGVAAIGNYFGSPIEPTLRGGDPFIYSPATEQAIAEFANDVLKPFGEFARKTTPTARRAAVLDSFASRVYGNSPAPYNHYPNYAVYNFYTVMNMAHIEADILFDESVEDGALAHYDLLALPCCDVLPESVYLAVLRFAQRGGIVIADQYLGADIPGVIRFDFDFEYRKRVNANANARKADFAVKDDTNFRQEWGGEVKVEGVPADRDQELMESYAAELRRVLDPVLPPRNADCSTPKLLLHMRQYGDGRYLFVTNDKRTWGDRVGEWRSMLEKGESERGTIRVRLPEGEYHVRELISGKGLSVRRDGDDLVFELEVGAASGAIVAIHPGSPRKMGLENRTLTSTFTTGLQVLRLCWTRDGNASDYDGFYVAADGVLALPERNDGEGWTLEACDLCTGMTATFPA